MLCGQNYIVGPILKATTLLFKGRVYVLLTAPSPQNSSHPNQVHLGLMTALSQLMVVQLVFTANLT